MQIEKREYKVFEFDELNEEAKQKAIEDNWEINVDYQWHYDEMIEDIAEKYGLKAHFAEACFDLDRGSYFFFDTHDHGGRKIQGLVVADAIKLLKLAGIKGKRAKELEDYLGIESNDHYNRNYIVCEELTGEEEHQLNDVIYTFCEEELKYLRDQYEYLTSKEAIVDTINANEYQFTEDGKLFTL